jgi:hypothetical protein
MMDKGLTHCPPKASVFKQGTVFQFNCNYGLSYFSDRLAEEI